MTHREYHAFAFGAHNYDASRPLDFPGGSPVFEQHKE